MTKNYIIFLRVLVPLFLIAGCGSRDGEQPKSFGSSACIEKLTADERQLVEKIIADMCKNKGEEKLVGENSISYYYYDKVVNPQKIKPISAGYKKTLVGQYKSKREKIELLNGRQLRNGEDTKSIWISVDEFAPYFGQLLQYEIDSNTTVGMKIELGSYEWDTKDSEMNGAARKYGDSLSGRNTVVFVGTYDPVKGRKDYFVARHREIPEFSTSVPIQVASRGRGFDPIVNHGTLCPDSCGP